MVGLSLRAAAALAVLTVALSTTARAAEAEDDAEETAAKAEAAKPGGDPCIDEDVKADLFAKRKQRTSRDRLFQQTNRHELSLRTGYYASDTFDGVVYARQAKVGSVPLYTFGIFACASEYTRSASNISWVRGRPSSTANVRSSSGPPREVSWVTAAVASTAKSSVMWYEYAKAKTPKV